MFGLALLLLSVVSVAASSLQNGSNETMYCIEKEKQALHSFRDSLIVTEGAYSDPLPSWDWDLLSSWSIEDCCKWRGVECSTQTGHVIKIDLSRVSSSIIVDNINPLLELQELNFLDLAFMSFGNRPFPKLFGSFTKLKHLDLSGCDFTGTIPSQLGNLSNLNYLSILPFTNLSVENVNWLSRLSSLQTLKMHGVDLSRANNWVDIIKSLPFLSTISLSRCQLSKVMSPSSLINSSSTRIKVLDLSSNGFTSSIYSWLFNFSTSIEHLDLSSNQLKGTLSENLGTPSQLEYLDLSANSLTGIVSEAHLSNLSRLTYLDMSLNSVDIKVSPQWFPSFQLSFLTLTSCNLGPSFPNWIRTQKNLTGLDISNTGISDNIPPWFRDPFANIQYLDLSLNNIRGTLPDLSSKFHVLIDLSSNKFEGPIPFFPSTSTSINLSRNKFSGTLSFLCQLSDAPLSFLEISNNLFTGGLPDCLGKLKELHYVNLANNRLSGEIPSSLGSLFHLEMLNLYNNSFSGELPQSFPNFERMSFLDLGENNLTGNIPAWIGGNQSWLTIFSLRSNKFYGTIPSSLCQLHSLQVLDISKNNLAGTIPPCISNLSSMAQMISGGFDTSPASYGWQGREVEFHDNIKLFKIIDLSNNNLSGEIPDEITELSGLVSLNLSRNALQGVIPQRIGKLKSIISLDLSRNKLSGRIPASLSQLNFLSYLDLSDNKLSGKIPSGTQIQSQDASKFVGNDELCGPPLTSKCPGDESPPTVVSSKDNEGDNNDDEFTKWLYMGMAAGFVSGFWGICGVFFLNRRSRHAFFIFVEDLTDWFYVKVKVAARRF